MSREITWVIAPISIIVAILLNFRWRVSRNRTTNFELIEVVCYFSSLSVYNKNLNRFNYFSKNYHKFKDKILFQYFSITPMKSSRFKGIKIKFQNSTQINPWTKISLNIYNYATQYSFSFINVFSSPFLNVQKKTLETRRFMITAIVEWRKESLRKIWQLV